MEGEIKSADLVLRVFVCVAGVRGGRECKLSCHFVHCAMAECAFVCTCEVREEGGGKLGRISSHSRTVWSVEPPGEAALQPELRSLFCFPVWRKGNSLGGGGATFFLRCLSVLLMFGGEETAIFQAEKVILGARMLYSCSDPEHRGSKHDLSLKAMSHTHFAHFEFFSSSIVGQKKDLFSHQLWNFSNLKRLEVTFIISIPQVSQKNPII